MTAEEVADRLATTMRRTLNATLIDVRAMWPDAPRVFLVAAYAEVGRAIQSKVDALAAALPDDAQVDWVAFEAEVAQTQYEYMAALKAARAARLN